MPFILLFFFFYPSDGFIDQKSCSSGNRRRVRGAFPVDNSVRSLCIGEVIFFLMFPRVNRIADTIAYLRIL